MHLNLGHIAKKSANKSFHFPHLPELLEFLNTVGKWLNLRTFIHPLIHVIQTF